MLPKRINAPAFLPERKCPLILRRLGVWCPRKIRYFMRRLLKCGCFNLSYSGIIWWQDQVVSLNLPLDGVDLHLIYRAIIWLRECELHDTYSWLWARWGASPLSRNSLALLIRAKLERVKRLKLLSLAWKARAQSLYHTRITRFTARLNAYAYSSNWCLPVGIEPLALRDRVYSAAASPDCSYLWKALNFCRVLDFSLVQ